MAEPASAEPSTPAGSSSARRLRFSSSDESSAELAGEAGEAHLSEAAPLLVPGGAGPSAPSCMRQRRPGRAPALPYA